MHLSPTSDNINLNEKDFFNKELNQYECIKEAANKALLLFKDEKTDSKGYTRRIAVARVVAKTVH